MYQPATGVRDLLPRDVHQKLWIEERLQRVFRRWGYERIITPTLERLETLQASGSIDLDAILQLRDAEGTPLGLRPDPTPSLARAVATRLSDGPWPLRLSYQTNVFRSTARPQEFYQAGVELIGADGPLADAEVLLLLVDTLRELDLGDWTVILGAVGFTRAWLAQVPTVARTRMRRALAALDRVAIERESALEPTLRSALLTVFDLRGAPADVLARAAALPLDAHQRGDLGRLGELVAALEDAEVVLDLSLVQAFDYYTGIVFEVSAASRLLGQGGRYDQLLASYGHPAPGAGFALNLDALQQVLQETGRLGGLSRASGGVLVVPEADAARPHALREAARLRRTAAGPVELELLGRRQQAVYEHARARGLAEVVEVEADGSVRHIRL